jgi:D-amino peptidase
MRFMIRSDIEGVTGVTTYQQAEGTSFGQAMLMNDLNAMVAGILAAGSHEIVVYDEHTDGRNVRLEDLPEEVSVICGKPDYRDDWGGIDASFDAMLMVGFHARSGVPGALLPHSYSRKNLSITINGFEVGEIGMEAAIAGDFGVPVWLVTGDSAGMAEAEAILPGVRTVTVKKAMGETAALCHAPRRTAREILEAAKEIVEAPPDVQPLVFAGPVELGLHIADSPYLEALRKLFPKPFADANHLLLTSSSVTAAWSEYLRMQRETKQHLTKQG